MVIRALHLKLWRDLVRLRGQVLSVVVMTACAVALFVALRSMHAYLSGTQAAYYRDARFADVFAPFAGGPASLQQRARALPGVREARTRVVMDVVADVPGLDEPATVRLIGVPAPRRPIINDVHLRRGRWVTRGRRGEVLVSEAFARANGLAIGDSVGAVLNGAWEQLRIVGIALSPEYVYEISPGGLFPDNRRFGVMWLDERELAAAFDLESAANDLVVTLEPGVRARDLIPAIDRLLRPYGGLGAFDRDDQTSHRFVSDEIAETRVTSTVTPAIFLGATMFVLHLILTRLVALQRDQLAVLKAFGYRNSQVALHIMLLALIPVLVGTALGSGAGLWLASGLGRLYAKFFQFPLVRYRPDPTVALAAGVITGAAALVAAVLAVRRAIALAPAEAMRPPAPARFRRGWLERAGLLARLAPGPRLVFRNIVRRPARAVFSAAGIALGCSLAVAGLFAWDAIERLKTIQFHVVQREDVAVTFTRPRDPGAIRSLARLPGVLRVEPFRAAAATLRHGQRSDRAALIGLEPGGTLRWIVDGDGRRQPLPLRGLLLSASLARRLDVRAGDQVTVELMEGRRLAREVPVGAVTEELMGGGAYLERGALNRLMREGPALSGAWLSVDARQADALYAALKRLPAVSGVAVRRSALRSFEATLAESFALSLSVIVVFSTLIVFAIVYNNARIALSERGRELASLRVLGFARREVARLLLGEQAFLTLAGIPSGLVLGSGLAWLIASRFATDSFRIPLVIDRTTYAAAAALVLAAALVSGWIVRRRLDRSDLVEVLKVRE